MYKPHTFAYPLGNGIHRLDLGRDTSEIVSHCHVIWMAITILIEHKSTMSRNLVTLLLSR